VKELLRRCQPSVRPAVKPPRTSPTKLTSKQCVAACKQLPLHTSTTGRHGAAEFKAVAVTQHDAPVEKNSPSACGMWTMDGVCHISLQTIPGCEQKNKLKKSACYRADMGGNNHSGHRGRLLGRADRCSGRDHCCCLEAQQHRPQAAVAAKPLAK
jgi:hypothetical protein